MGTWCAGPVLLEIVVPAHNEAGRLPAGLGLLSDKLAGLPVRAEVIVVDNASTDGTAEIARSWRGPVRVRVVRCDRRGKGAAVRAGLLATRAPWVGFMDADMATDLAALDDVLELLGDGRQVVVGSRRHDRSVVQAYALPVRRLGAVTFNRIVRDLAGGIADTQCGFKFFAGPLARAAAADLRTAGFSFDVELLAHCVRRGAEVTAIPVVWRDRPGSTFSVRRHSLRCLIDLALIRARAGSGGPLQSVRVPAQASAPSGEAPGAVAVRETPRAASGYGRG
ncbi:glycosyl transferase family 2 [Actinomadura sp. CNU-125]|uniref:glycosyltransferase n=1 Tax=Actinomadura sp. CNU-125 TaxID=1904961 RepID=UPI00095C5D41|nr:glycosyltransferase [Actinomadura sp. CNU-125]OLT10325.1 glycosyl transferase family 2 [Actinomadura sp. CNU-125]